jgi:hypothetical protein
MIRQAVPFGTVPNGTAEDFSLQVVGIAGYCQMQR